MDNINGDPGMSLPIHISYTLSPAGQRAAMKAGHVPHRVQSMQVQHGNPHYGDLVDIVELSFDYNGRVQSAVAIDLSEPYGWAVQRSDSWDDEHQELFTAGVYRAMDPGTAREYDELLDLPTAVRIARERWEDAMTRKHAAEQEWAALEKETSEKEARIIERHRAEGEKVLKQCAALGMFDGAEDLPLTFTDPAVEHLFMTLYSKEDPGSEFNPRSALGAATEALRRAKREFTLMSDAENWIHNRGSTRLKLALKAGMLKQSLAAYRDERLKTELPGWEWASPDLKLEAARNPPERALAALLEARTKSDEASLQFEKRTNSYIIQMPFLDRIAVQLV